MSLIHKSTEIIVFYKSIFIHFERNFSLWTTTRADVTTANFGQTSEKVHLGENISLADNVMVRWQWKNATCVPESQMISRNALVINCLCWCCFLTHPIKHNAKQHASHLWQPATYNIIKKRKSRRIRGTQCRFCRKWTQRRKNSLWPRMTVLGECHSNCGAITGRAWWVIALRSRASLSWRTLHTLPHLWPNLWRWHLKCWFWSTYANCCNFPDEAPFWYLDVAKIVLHFLCGLLLPFALCSVSSKCLWKHTKLPANCIRLPTLWKGKLLANLFKPLAYFHQLWYLVFMIA